MASAQGHSGQVPLQALTHEPGTHIMASGALATLSGAAAASLTLKHAGHTPASLACAAS